MSRRTVCLDEVAPSSRMGGLDWALLTPGSVGSRAGFFGTLALAPGEVVTWHRHAFSDESLYVCSGEMTVRIGPDVHVAGPGTAVFVPRGDAHRFESTGAEQLFAVYHLGPLAPRPELGHEDLEAVPHPAAAPPAVGVRS